ncbi:MAG: FkbM family methyltransferase, partial [Bacteroidota bacterium]|nr:FkbM family methyltransferase [Bacteroidota bacterium]
MNGYRDSDAFLREVNRWIDPGSVSVIIDAGTLDGADALALAAHFPSAVVYAFECNPAAITRCRERLRNTERVHLIEAAVSEKDGETDFYAIDPGRTMTSHADGNIGASSLFRASGLYPHERYVQHAIRVRTVRLDSWAASAGVTSVDILWLDLQGAELLALRGLGRLLETVR